MEDRSWAQGMTQEQFNNEFQRRHPTWDMIPDIKNYLKNEQPLKMGMDPFNPEMLEKDLCAQEEIEAKKSAKVYKMPEQPEDRSKRFQEQNTIHNCKYCNREVKSRIGLLRHESLCLAESKVDKNLNKILA